MKVIEDTELQNRAGERSELTALRHDLFLSRKHKQKSLENSKFVKLEVSLMFPFYKKLWSAIDNHSL